VGVFPLDVGIVQRADFVEGTLPEVEGKRQDVGFSAESQGFLAIPLLAILEGISQTALHPLAGVHRGLDGDLVRGAFFQKSSGACIESLCVLPHHDEVNVLWSFVLQRRVHARIEFYRAQVDVLIQLKSKSEQNPLLQDPRLHVGMPDSS